MKSLLFALLFSVGTAFIARADVFIYKNRIAYTLTGGGSTVKNAISGWTIIDDGGSVSQVLAYTAQKRFAVAPMQSITFTVGDGGSGKQYTFFVQEDQWTDGSGNLHIDTGGAKGLNSTMTVNGVARGIPKTYTWAGRSFYQSSTNGAGSFGETSGTFLFDKVSTAASNSQGDDINAAAQRLADSLLQKGYQQF